MSGTTPLHDAAARGDSSELRRLIKAMGDIPDVNSKNEKGETGLYVAAFHKHPECVKILIEADGVVNAKNVNGYTPLHAAAYNGSTEAAYHLLQNHAVVNVRNKNGWTPLHRAAYRGNVEVAALLLDNKANVNCKNDDGYTPLYLASYNNHKAGCELLLERGADVYLSNNENKNAIDIARSKGYIELTKFLTRMGKISTLEKRVVALEKELEEATSGRTKLERDTQEITQKLKKAQHELDVQNTRLEQLYGSGIDSLSLTELQDLENVFNSTLVKIRTAKAKFRRKVICTDGESKMVLIPSGTYMILNS